MTAVQMQAFEQWLALPGHHCVFEQERQLWRSLGPRPHSAAKPLAHRGRRRSSRSRRWQRAALATAALLLLTVIAPQVWLLLRADHRSGASIAEVVLPDGTRAVLDADSAIAVRYGPRERHIELLRGEAWFEVTPDPHRPFRVGSGEGVVEDIATAFAVSRHADQTLAGVEQGRVRVAAREGGGWTYLQAGQRARYASGGRVQRLPDVAPDRVATWRRGELVLEGADVESALRQVARYRRGATFVRGDLSALQAVNAALRVDQPEQALDALAATAGLTVTRFPLGLAIVQATGASSRRR